MAKQRRPPRPLSADVPISDPKQDELGRYPFAKALATTVKSMKGQDSFVFGLCGPWGSGKSSVLKLIARELESGPEQKRPIIVEFNPWWFSGHDQLLSAFLAQLGSVVGRIDTGVRVSGLGSKLSTLGKLLRPFGQIPGIPVVKDASEALQAAGEATEKLGAQLSGDVNKIRREIDELLRRQKRRIVVVMDDIDRLTAEEIAQLFLIVKAVADFPNTVYLLAFDHAVVTKAIDEVLHLDGAAYLEKIVQVQIDIPPSSPVQLQSLFLSQMEAIVRADAVTDESKMVFANLFHDGLKSFFQTPRHVKRLTNVLRVLYPAVEGEVYWPDFVTIMELMVFVPAVFRVIRDNPERFTGAGDRRDFNQDEEKRFHDAWLNQLPECVRESVSGIVCRLFPRASLALGKGAFSLEFESQWRADLRVCSADCFDRYFQLRILEGAFSEAEWNEVVACLGDSKQLDKRVRGFCHEKGPYGLASRAKEFLERVSLFCKHQATDDQAKILFEALLRIGDEFLAVPDLERAHMLGISNEMRLSWAMQEAVERIGDMPDRERFLETCYGREFGLRTGTQFAWFVGAQHGKYGAKPNRPDQAHLVSDGLAGRLAQIVVERLRSAAGDGTLAAHPKCLLLLYDWRRFGAESEARKWIQEFVADDQNFVRILGQAKSVGTVRGLRDHMATEVPTIDANGLVTWFDGSELRRRSGSILEAKPPWLTEEGEQTLELMMQMIDDASKPRDPLWAHHHRRLGKN